MTRYLLLPMQPTPNGTLHLGHIAGPYLRADILARALRRQGDEVSVICGADVYENWIQLPALRSNVSPETLCRNNGNAIHEDLRSMGIGVESWIDPLGEVDSGAYAALHNELLDRGVRGGGLFLKSERIPYAENTGRAVTGVWLLGRCPGCGLPAGGNCCENCGFHYQPDQILDPRSRLDEGRLIWREERSWFARADDPARIESRLSGLTGSPVFRDLAIRYLRSTGAEVRLTAPGDWGVANRIDGNGAVVCNTFFAYCVYCGEHFTRLTGRPNPLREGADRDTQVVALAGVDNLVAALITPLVLSGCLPGTRGFDRVILNRFLLLDGAKFSTSRRHGIWVSDVAANKAMSTDELRLFLSSLSLGEDEVNFDVAALIQFVNWHRRRLGSRIAEGEMEIRDIPAGAILQMLKGRGIPVQYAAVEDIRPDALLAAYLAWLSNDDVRRSDPALWRAALAFLVEPLAPLLAAELRSGRKGEEGILIRAGRDLVDADLRSIVHLQQEN